jgi:hypothetical protein
MSTTAQSGNGHPPTGPALRSLTRRVHYLAGLAIGPFLVVLYLTGLAHPWACFLSRPLAGTVRNATVSRDGLGWHISFGVDAARDRRLVLLALGYRMWWRRRGSPNASADVRGPSVVQLEPRVGVGVALSTVAVAWVMPVLGGILVGFLLLDVAASRSRRTSPVSQHR